jgi:predicted N-acetyltransferase YhbS
MINQIEIRPEVPDDYLGISKVNDLAFGRSNEALLVHLLRKLESFDPRLSLVALLGNDLVGHVLMFPVMIQAEQNAFPSLSLGPIAVLPEHQNQGIGSILISTAHQNARELGYTSVILLGHPGYYPRFGYRPASTWGLTNPWGIQGDTFMVIELITGSLEGKAGLVQYPQAFNQAA